MKNKINFEVFVGLIFVFGLSQTAGADPDLRPLTETEYLPAGWNGPIVVYTEPVSDISEIQGATQVNAGQTVYVGFYVGNYGSEDAGSFDVQIWDDTHTPSELILQEHVDGLQGGWAASMSRNYSWRFTKSGWHRLRLKVDSNNSITESSETNNEWSDQVVNVQGSGVKKDIPDVPAYVNDPNKYPIPNCSVCGPGICVATSSAAVLGYWDRTPYEGVTYSNLVANMVAPLRDTNPPNPNVKDLVLAIGSYYYVDHLSEIKDEITVDTVWRDGIRYVTNEVKGYDFDVQAYDIDSGHTNGQLFQKMRDEIDAGRPAIWAVDSLQGRDASAHAMPIIGYVDCTGTDFDSAYVHVNSNDDPPFSAYVYWDGGDILDAESDCVITIEPGGGIPAKTANPTPAHGATNQPINGNLSWSGGDGATSYDVYFGTDSTPDSGEFKRNQTTRVYHPGILQNNTTFYWRIDAKNTQGTTRGDVWRFTTRQAQSSITVTSPNGGENWLRGTRQTITWTTSGDVGSPVSIQLYKGGTFARWLAGPIPNSDRSYAWDIPQNLAEGSNYTIRIATYPDPSIYDESDRSFSITAPSVDLDVYKLVIRSGNYYEYGDEVTVTVYIANRGTHASDDYVVSLLASTNRDPYGIHLDDSDRYASVPGGGSLDFSLYGEFPSNTESSGYFIGVKLTCPNDTNETNNILWSDEAVEYERGF